MTDQSTLLALIARVEAATRPDRALDAEVALGLVPAGVIVCRERKGRRGL